MNTIVVNLLGGPGSGKSTMAASVFSELKWRDINCELAPEYAKDLVWEKRHKTFEDQIYIFGKQHHRIFRLLGQVSVVITDSPLLLTPVYDGERRELLANLAVAEFNRCNNLNFFINRKKAYNPIGRNQDLDGAKVKDDEIKACLTKYNINYYSVDGTPNDIRYVIDKIVEHLKQ
jgi:hypothetical protein